MHLDADRCLGSRADSGRSASSPSRVNIAADEAEFVHGAGPAAGTALEGGPADGHAGSPATAARKHGLLRPLLSSRHRATVETQATVMLLQILAAKDMQSGDVFKQLAVPVTAGFAGQPLSLGRSLR